MKTAYDFDYDALPTAEDYALTRKLLMLALDEKTNGRNDHFEGVYYYSDSWPMFPKDWDAMGMLIEKMKEKGYTVSILDGDQASAHFDPGGDAVAADTIPRAVALAALNVLEK